GHGPVVAAGTLALLPPLGRVLLQKCETALGRLPGLLRGRGGGDLFLGLFGASWRNAESEKTEGSHHNAGAHAEVHRRFPLEDSWTPRLNTQTPLVHASFA